MPAAVVLSDAERQELFQHTRVFQLGGIAVCGAEAAYVVVCDVYIDGLVAAVIEDQSL